jgi:uncharacterized protein (DUF1501 family)
MLIKRRKLIKNCCCGAAMGLAASFSRFGMVNAWAQAGTDYKALVCVFLFGGNDSNNLIVPFGNQAYAQYAAIRGGLALPQNSLLPIQSQSVGAPFGFHPQLGDLQTLYNQKNLAVLANVGTLARPVTRAQVLDGTGIVPANLFSHSDQQAQWQSSRVDGFSETGWGGRVADKVQPLNSTAMFPSLVSVYGSTMFVDGVSARSAAVNPGQLGGLDGFPNDPNDVRYLAMQQLLTFDTGLALVQTASSTMANAFRDNKTLTDALKSAPGLTTPFPTSDIGQQLLQVAKIIQVRSALGLKRQIFFVAMDGFDTHSDQLVNQQTLYGYLSPALNAFYQSTVELNLASQVTAFTLSDFGRTFLPASNAGTDHAWGSHHIIMGGAVKGGDIYGTFPTLALKGPDDGGEEGRWIPTTSLDQYGATVASWFGVRDADLNSVFPNLANFSTPKLTFLG